jgi:hypothetical protein
MQGVQGLISGSLKGRFQEEHVKWKHHTPSASAARHRYIGIGAVVVGVGVVVVDFGVWLLSHKFPTFTAFITFGNIVEAGVASEAASMAERLK